MNPFVISGLVTLLLLIKNRNKTAAAVVGAPSGGNVPKAAQILFQKGFETYSRNPAGPASSKIGCCGASPVTPVINVPTAPVFAQPVAPVISPIIGARLPVAPIVSSGFSGGFARPRYLSYY